MDFTRPIVDNTTKDWIVLKGQELNGWTAIQFKRLLDTCDPMDYPIKVFIHFHRFFKRAFYSLGKFSLIENLTRFRK
jgi:hypothetical protein